MNTSLKNILISLAAGAVGGLLIFFMLWHSFTAHLQKSFFGVSSNSATSSIASATHLHDALVIDTIKSDTPAVVSIAISQTIRQISEQSKDNGGGQFEQFFNNFFGLPTPTPQNPSQRKNARNPNELQEVAAGSGFFVSEDGYIITNKHVVSLQDATYTVYTNDGKKHPAKVIAKDPLLDIAVIKIDGSHFPTLSLGNSDTLQVGQTAIAIGNALGEFRNTVSVGIVSGLSRSIVAGDETGLSEMLDQVIQTDAAINPGNSGGPLLDLDGNVIGINVAVAAESQSVGFALPANQIKGVLDSVRKTGKIIRPYIGIRFIPITEAVKQEYNLSVDEGDFVKGGEDAPAIISDSPAMKAGIKEDDIILKADGNILTTNNSLTALVRSMNVGDRLSLEILRQGKKITIVVILEAAPEISE